MQVDGATRLDHVQGMRGALMLIIVIYHCDLPPTGAFVALDVFFVISGYVIAGQLLREKESTGHIRFSDFYLRRVRRLLPALSLMLVVTAALSALVESPLTGQRLTGRIGAYASVSLANLALYRTGTGYFDERASSVSLRHTWSLSVEEQFYLVFPLFVALLLWGHRRRLRVLVAGILVVSAVSFLALIVTAYASDLPGIHQPQSAAYYSPVTRVWEMGAGVLVAVWHLTRPPLPRRAAAWVGAVGTLAVVVAVVRFASEVESSNPAIGLPVVGGALMLVACRTPGLLSGALSWAPLTWVGDRSYGWYLWHWPLIVFAGDLWPDSRLALLVAGALGLVVSTVTYQLVEQRFRYPRRGATRPQRLRSGVLIALVCVVSSVGATSALLVVAQHNWGSPTIASMATQLLPRPPVVGRQGCPMDEVLSAGSAAVCTRGQGTGKPIYLVGDSNAAHLGTGLISAGDALDRPVALLWKAGCSYAEVSVRRPNYDGAACDEHNALVTRWLGTVPGATVVVANAGEFVNASRATFTAPGSDQAVSDPVAKSELWRAGLTRSLERLRELGDAVIVVGMVPHPGSVDPLGTSEWRPLTCGLLEIFDWRGTCAISVSLASEDARQRLSLEAEAAAVRATGVDYLDLRETLCPDGTCQTRREGRWIYRDTQHISEPESARLAPFLAGAVSTASGADARPGDPEIGSGS